MLAESEEPFCSVNAYCQHFGSTSQSVLEKPDIGSCKTLSLPSLSYSTEKEVRGGGGEGVSG